MATRPTRTSKPKNAKKSSLDGTAPQGELMRHKKKLKPMKVKLMRKK